MINDTPLHKLWTLAVGTDGYNKADWKELERRFHALAVDNENLRTLLRTANERLKAAGAIPIEVP